MRVDELKNKILQFAIQGKLVPQDDNDIPASVLLEEIKKEKEQLIKEKKIKREKPLPEITEEEKPFELPKGWEWCRCSELFNVRSAMRIHKTDWRDKGVPFLRGRELVQLSKYGKFDIEICIDEELYEILKEKSGIPQKDDILVSAVGTIGKVYIVKETDKFYYKDAYILCLENFSSMYSKYIKYMLESQELQMQIKKDSMATTVAQLTIIKAKSLLMPLPPLEEQKRIANKIDELFAIIDELAENKEAMLKNISDTRNKVLQLAIQGKLVEQNSEDTPVSVLLEEIRKEKEQLIKEKKIKKEKPLPEITEEEKLFELPKGWEWVRFSQVLDVRDGTHDTPKYVEKGVPLITSKNINGKEIDFDNVKYISMQDHIEISKRSNVDNGDILFAMIGSIGNPVIVNKKEEFSIKNVALFKFYKKNCVNNKFLYYYLLLAQNDMKSNSKGAVQSFVSLKILREYIFPLPSVEEQLRIVQKVDKIMAYLDELEKTILNDSII